MDSLTYLSRGIMHCWIWQMPTTEIMRVKPSFSASVCAVLIYPILLKSTITITLKTVPFQPVCSVGIYPTLIKSKSIFQSLHSVNYWYTKYYSRVERRTFTITVKTDILSLDRWAFYPVLTTAITTNAPGNEATFRPNLVSQSNQPDQCYTWCTVWQQWCCSKREIV